jgi:hypothetical protein
MHELRPHRRRDSRERPELVGKVGELIHEGNVNSPATWLGGPVVAEITAERWSWVAPAGGAQELHIEVEPSAPVDGYSIH